MGKLNSFSGLFKAVVMTALIVNAWFFYNKYRADQMYRLASVRAGTVSQLIVRSKMLRAVISRYRYEPKYIEELAATYITLMGATKSVEYEKLAWKVLNKLSHVAYNPFRYYYFSMRYYMNAGDYKHAVQYGNEMIKYYPNNPKYMRFYKEAQSKMELNNKY